MNLKTEISVGLIFFVALAVLGYYTILMSEKIFDNRKDYYYITVLFPDVEGLNRDDKVKINGVMSGKVDDIQLRSTNMVWVKLKMFNTFTLYSNYKIKIKSESALGGKYVAISPGGGFEKGREYAVVTTRESLEGAALGDPFGLISEFVEENRHDIREAISNLRMITEKINTGQGTLGKLVSRDTMHDNAEDLIKEIRETIEDSREQAPVTSFIRAALTAF